MSTTNDQRKDQQLPVKEGARLSSMPWWVWIIVATLLFALSYCVGYISRPRTDATTHTPPASYPLAGQIYPSNRAVGGYDPYVALWSRTGWLHQPNLPPEKTRTSFVIAITIEEGLYKFWGVSCDFWLDLDRTGSGDKGKPTLGRGNGIPFVVKTKDGGQAWGTVVCRDDGTNDVVGFSIQWIGTLP